MRKFLAFLLVACAAFGLVACGEKPTGPTLEAIEISGYDDQFTVGDDFTTAGLIVTAVYSDETTENVTVDAEIDSKNVDTDLNGVYPVVITYEGKTAYYMVTVLAKEEDAELQSISVSGQKTEFTVGDEFAQGDLVVTATYTDGTKVDVTKDSTIKQNADMQTPGKYAVVVSYGEKNTIYEINVVAPEPAPTLVSISLSGYTDKFTEGGSFVTTGLVVTATYSDDSTKDVTSEAKVENNVDMNIAGQYVVIVSYEDKVAYYEVTVFSKPEAAVLKNITVSGQKTEFKVGDKFETTGLVVTANYSDGTSVDVTNAANISQNADMTNAGKYAVLVSYNGQVAAYEIVVTEYENIKTLTGITVEAEEVKKLYAIGEGLDLNKLVVYEQYSNSQTEPSIEVFTDLSGYTVKVYNEGGQEVVGEFTEYGKYTVTVSKGNASDSFVITVGQKVFAAVEDAVKAGYENADKVASGKATVDNTGYVTEYTYAFGTNYTFVKDAYGEYHYQLLDGDNVFGIEVYDGYASKSYEPSLNNMLGIDFRSLMNYDYETLYGVESLVVLFSDIAKEEGFNFEESFHDICPICGLHRAYKFTYEVILNEYYYYYITVEFTLNDSNAFEDVNVSMNGYTIDNMVKDEETGIYTVIDGVNDYDFAKSVSATQEIGERSAVNPYSYDEILIKSFEVTDYNGIKVNNGDTVEGKLREEVSVNIINITPEDAANVGVDVIDVEITDETGAYTWYAYGNYYDGVLSIYASQTGVYNVRIFTTQCEFTFKYNVGFTTLSSLKAAVYNVNTGNLVETSTVTVYTNAEVAFGAIANDGADAGYTYELLDASENVTFGNDGSYDTFKASVEGTYIIVLTSKTNSAITTKLTINVTSAPSLEEVLNGKYVLSSGMLGDIEYVFTPEAAGALKGLLVVTVRNGYVGDVDATLAYEYSEGFLFVTPADVESQECLFGVELDANYNVCCTYNNFNQGAMTKEDDSSEGKDELAGTYKGTYTHPMNGMTFDMILVFNGDGTGSYDIMNNAYIGTFNYTYEGMLTMTNFVAIYGGEISIVGIYSEGIIYSTTSFDGGSAQVEYYIEGSSGPVEDTNELVYGDNEIKASFNGEEYTFIASEIGTHLFTVPEGYVVYPLGADAYAASNTYQVELGFYEEINLLVCAWEYVSGKVDITLTVEIKVEEEEGTFAGTYSAVYTHPMNGMMFDMILVFNADGTGSYMLMNNGYEGTFNYNYDVMLTMTDFVSTFGGELSIVGIVSEDTIYTTITLITDEAQINVDFVKE